MCSRPAVGPWHRTGEPYCRYHQPWLSRRITPDDIYDARAMQIMGWPLRNIAAELNVSPTNLDIALWRVLGRRDVPPGLL